MLKLFSGNAASTRALSVAAVACLLSAGAPAAQGDPPPLPAPLARYQKWAEEPVVDWRAANARVGEIGGWRTYVRESSEAPDQSGDVNAAESVPGTLHGDGHE
jgi:hypothetical protein